MPNSHTEDGQRASLAQTEAKRRLEIQSLNDLPPLPLVAQRLLALLGDEDVSVSQLAETIEMDPALAGRVIGLARSAYFSSPWPIYNVSDAIVRVLGLKSVKGLALTMALSKSLQPGRCAGFDLSRYWVGSMMTADLAQRLASYVGFALKAEPQSAYLGGLLHNLGLLVLAHLYPGPMAEALKDVQSDPELRLAEAERRRLGLDHHEAGAWLAFRWHLPKKVVAVMAHHHELGYRERYWPTSLLVGLCARRVQQRLNQNPPSLDAGTLEVLGISTENLEGLWTSCEARMDGLSEVARMIAEAS